MGEVSPAQVSKLLDSGFDAIQGDKTSFQDKRLQIYYYSRCGQFELALPTTGDIQMANNRSFAERRLHMLNNRLASDTEYRDEYTSHMEDMLKNAMLKRSLKMNYMYRMVKYGIYLIMPFTTLERRRCALSLIAVQYMVDILSMNIFFQGQV